MADSDPVNPSDPAAPSEGVGPVRAAAGREAQGAGASAGPAQPPNPLLAHLLSLQDLQVALARQDRDEEILRVGTAGAVEIVGADCGIACVDPTDGFPAVRAGSCEGRGMAQHEMEIMTRSLAEHAGQVREGKVPRVILAAEPRAGDPEPAAEPPAQFQSRGFGSVLILGVGLRAGLTGVLILARHEPRPFGRDRVILAEILASQLSIHVERVRRGTEARRAGGRLQGELEAATRTLREREEELAGLNAVAAAVGPSSDLERQIDMLLRKAMEVTRHAAGAVYLVEDQGGREPVLRFARGIGEAAYPEQTPEHASRRGEGLAGRVWEGGRPAAVPDLSADPAFERGPALHRAGYRSLICVPLRARARTVGVLELLATEHRGYAEAEVNLARAIGDQIGLAIQTGRLFLDVMRYSMELEERIERQAQDLARLERLAAQSTPQPQAALPQASSDIPAQLVQAQKMESIGTLASGIAHDFNNIIGAILGYATHIKSLVSEDNPIHREAATIEQQALRASVLTRQLLDFARGGEQRLEPVSLNLLLEETVSLLSKSIDPRIVLDAQCDAELPDVRADAGQMRQILLSVAVNARDALPEGGRITFETRLAHLDARFVRSCPGLEAGDYVEVVVQDSGVGMKPEVLDRVFEPFFTTKPEGQGTGLGLSVMYGIVKDHRGHVTISSTPFVGTTVRIYLPAAGRSSAPARPLPVPHLLQPRPPEEEEQGGPGPGVPRPGAPEPGVPPRAAEPAAGPGDPDFGGRDFDFPEGRGADPPAPIAEVWSGPSPDPEPGPAPGHDPLPVESARRAAGREEPPATPAPAARRPGPGGRVLVVDDEQTIRELAREILLSRGCEVLLARDGVEALEIYRREWGRISLVVLDMMMPRLGGLETFRRLRGMDRAIRVLLCSGYTPTDQARQAIKEGAVGLLPKPYTMSELLAWVDRLLPRESRT